LLILSINAPLPEVAGDRFKQVADEFDEFTEESTSQHKVPTQEPPPAGNERTLSPEKALAKIWNEQPRLLDYVSDHETLPKHAILTLNAERLRSQGVTINEALSWEQSAQDLQSALREHQALRNLSRFLHIIVRFGVTGIFHQQNHSHHAPLSDLYFDPERDDSAFKTARQGRVLGHNAVLLASLIQTITLACHRGNGGFLPVDLGPAITAALPQAISRSQALCRFGYDRLVEEAATVRDVKTQPKSRNEFPEDLFEHPLALKYSTNLGNEEDRKQIAVIPAIGHTRVANPLFDNWSIAAESLQPQMFHSCHSVVCHGVARSLNLPAWSPLTFVPAFKTTRGMELRRGVLGPSRRQSKRLSRLSEHLHESNIVRRGRTAATIVVELCDVMEEVARAFSESYKKDGARLDRLVGPVASYILADTFFDKIQEALNTVKSRSSLVGTLSVNEDKYVSADAFLGTFFEALRLPTILKNTNPLGPAPVAYFHGKASESERSQAKLIVVDRREIEGTRFLRNLIDEHLKGESDKPLPIAVFGPPGSGKTFAVKQIIESIRAGASDLAIEWVEDNLGQKTDFKQLDATFQKITGRMAEKKIPVAFFDEFDSSLDGNLGWLKLFLAPMEDGTYNGQSVGRSILVFAGGTSETFRAFSRQDLQKESKEWVDFTAAKGPDFVSRLRGHLDIIGINRSGPSDRLYPMRRAIVLRSWLEKIQRLKPFDDARIEKVVLDALMKVPRYRHGARSLRNLLGLFHNGEETISRSTLPPKSQAEMHVDAEAFWDLLFGEDPGRDRERSVRELKWKDKSKNSS
jgi:hypothetical protein